MLTCTKEKTDEANGNKPKCWLNLNYAQIIRLEETSAAIRIDPCTSLRLWLLTDLHSHPRSPAATLLKKQRPEKLKGIHLTKGSQNGEFY